MKIELRNLTRHFGETKAVDGINFSFSSGQIFGFIGPNGAGKTTAMRIMATLDEPTSGDAFIDSTSISQDPEIARRSIGYMPDNLPTHRDINVVDYLDFFARAYGIKNPRRRETIDSIMEFTNLLGIQEKMLKALSKGMKQRVSLARALIHDPPMLILDEPAAGLDPRARIELRELLRALAGQGKAILISSHILSELGEICDGAAIIEHGKILSAGTMDELSRGPGEAHTYVNIRPLSDPEKLHRKLLEMPLVVKAILNVEVVEVELTGSEEDSCDLLESLIQDGFRILEYQQRRAHLEEIFMDVTKGDVR